MTISYNWLSEYLPEKVGPEKLSKILTSIGLEVESLEKYDEVNGGFEGLFIGEVIACEKHPDADKLSVTKVHAGGADLLQIVCGAPNVAVGQKVVVAPIGSTIYPVNGTPVIMKKAKIRGVESFGMICAEDEIGLSDNHEGIMVLPADTKAGIPAAEYFKPYQDYVFEIGLTPNRMDAMSHIGVAKDVCAYLSHHNKTETPARLPYKNSFKPGQNERPVEIIVEKPEACPRYAGVTIKGVTIAQSPKWLQQKLKSIGLRPINNIVDITNFILHESGQPLHAFDADKITGNKIIVKTVVEGTPFVTLDEKERKLHAEDLMICNADAPMCIGGVYGGLDSGVTGNTKNIFLESAWFNPAFIRKTSLRHNLRTDAATRFEKGVDISQTVIVLKRAALLIAEIAGGKITSDVIDVYPVPKTKTEVGLKYHYLKKLSGKNYHGDTIKNILKGLSFEIIKEGMDEIRVTVPFSKPDISIPADIVEEIMRIDGLDNIDIPSAISITPSVETLAHESAYSEKTASFLTGIGFNEIFTNSITNAVHYKDEVLQKTVKMLNSLSADLNVMRPAMMETGLECIAYNCNRRNTDLLLFEFGKTYSTTGIGEYWEERHLSIYITGKIRNDGWKRTGEQADLYFAKGIAERIMLITGTRDITYSIVTDDKMNHCLQAKSRNDIIANIGSVHKEVLGKFDIRQPVFFIDILWDAVMPGVEKMVIQHNDVPKFPSAVRDLSIVVAKNLQYEQIERATVAARVPKLQTVNLFDIFESEKLGSDKKAMAISFTFLDEEKTLTDKDIDAMMGKIIGSYEKELNAEIRK